MNTEYPNNRTASRILAGFALTWAVAGLGLFTTLRGGDPPLEGLLAPVSRSSGADEVPPLALPEVARVRRPAQDAEPAPARPPKGSESRKSRPRPVRSERPSSALATRRR